MANSSGSFGALLKSISSMCKPDKEEVTPPGSEKIVKALKKKPGIDNPWAVAWAMKDKEALSRLPKVSKYRESATIVPTNDPAKLEGRIIDVVLVTEGLGNQRDMNYYGPEAIASGVSVFEGASSFLNHPSESESRDLPERRVQVKCGYFKNLKVEKVVNLESNAKVDGLCGELHLDLSEAGQTAFDKIRTAIHYRSEFPKLSAEYVGLSVNADGEAEKRMMTIEGKKDVEVNYVTTFARDPHTSCDIVTSPARGGRFRAVLVEDENGTARLINKEASMKFKKLLKSALELLKASESETDEAKKKLKVTEAVAAVKEAEDVASEAAVIGMEVFQRQDGESEAMHKKRLTALAKALKTEMSAYQSEDEAEDESETEDEDESKSKASEDEDEDDADDDSSQPPKKDMEAARAAVRHALMEAKVPVELYTEDDIEDLSKLPYRVAKRQIARESRQRKVTVKAVSESLRMPFTSVARGSDSDEEGGANDNAILIESFRGRR